MIMKTKAELAEQYFKEGYNCAQATAMAFAEEMHMDIKDVARMASSFGGGMGRLREVCGACSAMFLVYGVLCGYDDPTDPDAKMNHYKDVQALGNAFKDKFGSRVCKEILAGYMTHISDDPIPTKRDDEFYKTRPCVRCVVAGARILSDFLASKQH